MHQYHVVYTADLHGNEAQYHKLIAFAQEISADCVIIGGDIAPKDFPFATAITGQRQFLQERLPALFRPLKMQSPATEIFLMMGNDDCAANVDVFTAGASGLYRVLHGKRYRLQVPFDIVGYSYVPITPFGIKDWEKFDLSQAPPALAAAYAHRKSTNYTLDGFHSTREGWQPYHFRPEMEGADSIQKDLAQEVFRHNPGETIYVIHTPPDGTHLDQIAGGTHVGSLAVRWFIEASQPYLTLHGHIHETVEIPGQYKECIGKTWCMSPGNHSVGEHVAVLVFDVYQPFDVTRLIL
jgi:Icc-related predicted phosphoesterase